MTSEIELIEKVQTLSEKVNFRFPPDEQFKTRQILLKHIKNTNCSINAENLDKILSQEFKLNQVFDYYLSLFHHPIIKEGSYQNLLIQLTESIFSEVDETKSYFTLCENKNTIRFSDYFLYAAYSKAENYKESFYLSYVIKKDVINGFFKILKAIKPSVREEGFLFIGFAYYFKNEAYRNKLREIFNY